MYIPQSSYLRPLPSKRPVYISIFCLSVTISDPITFFKKQKRWQNLLFKERAPLYFLKYKEYVSGTRTLQQSSRKSLLQSTDIPQIKAESLTTFLPIILMRTIILIQHVRPVFKCLKPSDTQKPCLILTTEIHGSDFARVK